MWDSTKLDLIENKLRFILKKVVLVDKENLQLKQDNTHLGQKIQHLEKYCDSVLILLKQIISTHTTQQEHIDKALAILHQFDTKKENLYPFIPIDILKNNTHTSSHLAEDNSLDFSFNTRQTDSIPSIMTIVEEEKKPIDLGDLIN